MKTRRSIYPIIVFFIIANAVLPFLLNAQTPIPVENFSFEEPGMEKIKGWDGECSDPAWTGLLEDIPGWYSDLPAFDSGVETGQAPTDGLWTAFLMAQDTSVYQITEYLIQEGDDIELTVDARITWQATLLDMGLFYADSLWTIYPIVNEPCEITSAMMDYSVRFKASEIPASIGRKLGVYFDNVSPTAKSWIGLDNVRLINYGSTDVSERHAEMNGFSLAGNYPNPFNPITRISYALRSPGAVRLSVYDLLGREKAVLANGIQNAGEHQVEFSGAGLPGGIYIYKLQTGNNVVARKMILAK
jgi:hypothetical protein